jgi:septation ring formation regulator EzrA
MTAVERRLTSVESQIVQLRREMNVGFSETKAEMHKLNKETMAQARVLYEDLKETIKKMGEGPGGEPK